MTAIVQFDNVGLRYGTAAEILSGISFSLTSGSYHILAGASGAGKSSLLNLMSLAARPSRGMVRLFGTDTSIASRSRLPALRRRMGIVRQDAQLVPSLTVPDNVALPLRIAGLSGREVDRRVEEALDWVGLAQRGAVLPAALSTGERQRVAVARAVIGRPDLIIADEPTGHLDSDMARRILDLLDRLHAGGATIMLATHDPQLVAGRARVERMHLVRGRIETLRSPAPHQPGYDAA
jgi:cell division transport system ATP-binding protein